MIPTLTDVIAQTPLFGWAMSIFGILLFLWGVIIFVQDTTKRRGKFFLFYTALVAVWGVLLMFLYHAEDVVLMKAALAALFLVAGAIPLVLFLFFYIFPARDEPFLWRKAFGIFSPYAIIVGMVLASESVIKYSEVNEGVPLLSFLGRGYLLYLGYIVIFSALTLKVLFEKYRTSVGIFSAQSRSILFALAAAALVFVIGVSFVPHPISAYHTFLAGYAALVVSALMLGYILIKYNFWSIRIIATEFVSLVTVVVLPVGFFVTTSSSGLVIHAIVSLAVVGASFFVVDRAKRDMGVHDEIARLKSELADMRARLKVLDKKKSEFLEMAAHHLRDPLTAIKGYSSMLLEGSYGELAPQIHSAIEKIFESSKRLVIMVSDFMDITSIESGDTVYRFTDVDLRPLVLAITESMQVTARHSGIKLDIVVEDGDEDAYIVRADEAKIRQVFLSLMDNAIKYTPQGNISVLLSRVPARNTVMCSVSDTGIGMSIDTMNKIFKKFSRAASANRTYTEGLGLGLYVAKEMIKQHGGTIRATSKGEGFGSTFYVELPKK